MVSPEDQSNQAVPPPNHRDNLNRGIQSEEDIIGRLFKQYGSPLAENNPGAAQAQTQELLAVRPKQLIKPQKEEIGSYVEEGLPDDAYQTISENARKLDKWLGVGIPTDKEVWSVLLKHEGLDVEAALKELEPYWDNIDTSDPTWIQYKRRAI